MSDATRLSPEWVAPLVRFLEALHAAGDDAHFHPHPATAGAVEEIAREGGPDLYYVVPNGAEVVGYGMLRGWAEYDVPSLGVAVHPGRRGRGIGRELTAFLHDEARRHGASKVRLKVYPDNAAARRLYEELGYEFDGREEDGQLVGVIEL
jgi:[ribosomal protein S18]-alanine N-acetyltransferase